MAQQQPEWQSQYAVGRILAEAVAGLPLHLYRYKEDGGKEKAIDHPLYLLLHDEPNPEMSSFVFRETLMTHLLLWGCLLYTSNEPCGSNPAGLSVSDSLWRPAAW